MIITPELAWRIRLNGLEIYGPDAKYSSTELEQLALRQHQLLTELKELDEELEEMAAPSQKEPPCQP